MKVLFCGLGSIGQRHLSNLVRVGNENDITLEIHAFRSGDKPLPNDVKQHIRKEIFTSDGLDNNYDVAFITNPTSMHYPIIKLLENKTANMFIEKPIFEKHMDISTLNLSHNGVYYVAGPLKYSPVVMKIRELAQTEHIFSVRAICSSFLPDWRPGTNYRQSYSARKELGGGVAIDLIHEWDYITSIFGFPKQVFGLFDQVSDLEITSEDIAVYIAKYEKMIVELHLDYFGKHAKRQIELITDRGTISGDILGNKITFSDGRQPLVLTKERNDLYLSEMEYFINIVQEPNLKRNDFERANRLLKLANGEDIQ